MDTAAVRRLFEGHSPQLPKTVGCLIQEIGQYTSSQAVCRLAMAMQRVPGGRWDSWKGLFLSLALWIDEDPAPTATPILNDGSTRVLGALAAIHTGGGQGEDTVPLDEDLLTRVSVLLLRSPFPDLDACELACGMMPDTSELERARALLVQHHWRPTFLPQEALPHV